MKMYRKIKEKKKNKKVNQQYREKRKRNTMWIMAAGRELITCKPEIDEEGGVGSSSRWEHKKIPSSRRWAAEWTWKRSAAHTKQFGRGEFE
jgi:hypothetical protein